MTSISILTLLFLILINAPFANESVIKCAPKKDNELQLYSNDFKWNITFDEMDKKNKEIYLSGKRLPKRLYFNKTENSFKAKLPIIDKEIIIPYRFINSITKHIEKALNQRYADFINFSDMGHNHFHIPNDLWEQVYKKIDAIDEIYSLLVNEPRLKMLYHTAEQIKLTDENNHLSPDPYTQQRYYTRNIVGLNNETDYMDIHFANIDQFNTVRDVPEHTLWSAGVNISSSSDGCFSYRHKGSIFYYDISFFDLGNDPNGGYAGGYYSKSVNDFLSLKELFQNGLSKERYRPPLTH